MRDEVAAPLGVPDELFFGVPAAHLPRAARSAEVDSADPLLEFPPGSLYHEVLPSWMQVGTGLGNRPGYQVLDVPSGGMATAYAQARMFAALIGGVDGVRLVGPARSNRIASLVTARRDRVMGLPYRRGLGYFIGTLEMGHSGAFGGSGSGHVSFADPVRGLSFAYTRNLETTNPLGTSYEAADVLRAELGLEHPRLQRLRRRIAEHALRRARSRVAKERAADVRRRRDDRAAMRK